LIEDDCFVIRIGDHRLKRSRDREVVECREVLIGSTPLRKEADDTSGDYDERDHADHDPTSDFVAFRLSGVIASSCTGVLTRCLWHGKSIESAT
jgi:hypothetical protein